ncbi:MAG TPA: acetyl-CoA carboxylase biotin carboxylase subunit [Ktedonobacteraceae bacterium]|nr:acetyl-CoA carboxylase biotin carboxylase subunit [Ktedonobacteraceae bacterium]
MFKKILIANRDEIAVRIIATCREMHIRTVAVYSEADRTARHVREADEAYELGPAPATESYLSIERIIAVARQCGAEAIHPGYGFLSENPRFAEACEQAGLIFIGPSARAMRLLGAKIAAKQLALEIGVPTVPGYHGPLQAEGHLAGEAERIGFPLLIKASAGGGGKGMRIVTALTDFLPQLQAAQREAQAAFGDATVFLERLIERPRHVEFQILADTIGHCIHLGERECSLQRRHQKIVEESPSPALSPDLRARMGTDAVRLAYAANYVNAGTLEFLLTEDGHYYFLEMNTRLQVEHPVTELVTGLDLVRLQLQIAAGEPLPCTQEQITQRGHAIEVRLYAEDPTRNFLPSTGTITCYHPPSGPGIRIDSGLETGDEVTQFYDPMLAKIIVSATDRPAAIQRLQRALADTIIFGVTTNLPLLTAISAHPAFQQGHTHTDFLAEQHLLASPVPSQPPLEVFMVAACADLQHEISPSAIHQPINRHILSTALPPWQDLGPWRMTGMTRSLTYYEDRMGQTYHVTLRADPRDRQSWWLQVNDQPAEKLTFVLKQQAFLLLRRGSEQVRAYVQQNEHVTQVVLGGQSYVLCRRRAPDVATSAQERASGPAQRALAAPMAGTIVKVLVQPGEAVAANQVLVILSTMKMEHSITAPYAGKVQRVLYQEGAVVAGNATVIEMAPEV